MNNIYIKSVPVNLFNGVFNTVINFNNGLNIISGINGTGKTQVLQLLKNNQGVSSDATKRTSELSIFAISPKRNTEKQAIDSIFQQVRTQGKSMQTFFTSINNYQMKDSGFESYPSFAELFIQEYESIMQDGVTGHSKAIEETSRKFNEVLDQVFKDYKIEAQWIAGQDGISGKLDIKIRKYSADPINIDQLSTGEREVFALLFCIFVSRDKEDIYLIDEPEIHLNWDLEKGLFYYFNWFCTKFEKQIIVVTHSRIIFKEEFYLKTQFLLWDDGKIICRPQISEEQKASIAGDMSETINTVKFDKKTFFVEDTMQKMFVEELANTLEKEVEVIICGSKDNVTSLYKLFQKTGVNNSYFLVDGDNEGCNISDDRYIKLKKYCIENYLLNPYLLSKVLNISEEDIKEKMLSCISELPRNKHLAILKKLVEIADPFPFDILDNVKGKDIIEKLVKKYEKTKEDLVKPYVELAQKEGKINDMFDEITSKMNL
ncbi:MAG: AAA family ATPase [Bacilli bacterium]